MEWIVRTGGWWYVVRVMEERVESGGRCDEDGWRTLAAAAAVEAAQHKECATVELLGKRFWRNPSSSKRIKMFNATELN
ncbi:Protein of unknown function [Gryllus bimaculatus]|nr:Protein of unknown function [Gryllus bimaculatus]